MNPPIPFDSAAEYKDARKKSQIYFDIELDDAGLEMDQYRLYGRIARRAAGEAGACSESVPNMAAACKMSRAQAFRALSVLIARRMIRRETRSGHTSVYTLLDKSEWLPEPPTTDKPGPGRPEKTVDPSQCETGTPLSESPAPSQAETGLLSGRDGTPLSVRRDPSQREIQRKQYKKTREENMAEPSSPPAAAPSEDSEVRTLPQQCHDIFAALYLTQYGTPYIGKTGQDGKKSAKGGDFIVLNRMIKAYAAQNWDVTTDRFRRAAANYLKTPQASHTIADLCNRFGTFFKATLNQYGRPEGLPSPASKPSPTQTTPAAFKCTKCNDRGFYGTAQGVKDCECTQHKQHAA